MLTIKIQMEWVFILILSSRKLFLIKHGIIKIGYKHDNVAEKEFVSRLIKKEKVITLERYLKI